MAKDIEQSIELGFAEDCEDWLLTNRYFPSKIGGKPAWLDLENLPKPEDLKCNKCEKQKVLLCQVYAPIESNEECFHRSIFVFICRSKTCYQNNSSENITVFRCQLKRSNSFYSFDPPEDDKNLEAIPTSTKLCFACGCQGTLTCSRCKKTNYCSADHQKLDWKHHKIVCHQNTQSLPSLEPNNEVVFPQYEICIEPESISVKQSNSKCEENDGNKSDAERLEEYNELVKNGKDGVLKDTSESELSQYFAPNLENLDKHFEKFKKIIKTSPQQILRYHRKGVPLWITELDNNWQNKIPNCENCGKMRCFEFQIMPQMLNYLKNDDIDWGVIAIFTCSASCNINGYAKEFVIKQDIVK